MTVHCSEKRFVKFEKSSVVVDVRQVQLRSGKKDETFSCVCVSSVL